MITVSVTVSRKMVVGISLAVILLVLGLVYGRVLWGDSEVEWRYIEFTFSQPYEGCIFISQREGSTVNTYRCPPRSVPRKGLLQKLFGALRQAPQPTPVPTPEWVDLPVSERWPAIRSQLPASVLKGLYRHWYEGGRLTPTEKVRLRSVHKRFDLGQPDFNIWVNQTLRQLAGQDAVAPAR